MDPEHIRPVPARAGSDQDCRVCMRCCWTPNWPCHQRPLLTILWRKDLGRIFIRIPHRYRRYENMYWWCIIKWICLWYKTQIAVFHPRSCCVQPGMSQESTLLRTWSNLHRWIRVALTVGEGLVVRDRVWVYVCACGVDSCGEYMYWHASKQQPPTSDLTGDWWHLWRSWYMIMIILWFK